VYDQQVWGRAEKQSPKDEVGATSLLSQLGLHGVNVGDRWQELSIYLYQRLGKHAPVF